MAKRKIAQQVTFNNKGTFQAFWAAEAWCRENGYSTGSTCVPYKEVAITRGEYNLPQKWKNMSAKERASVDGIISSGNYREGPVNIIIYS